MHRNQSASSHQFAMIPRASIPRSSFRIQKAHKTTFDAGYLVPIYCEEVLPGDTFNLNMTAFCRMSTPIYPIMDNLYLESFFFFVPNRLVWDNWRAFMGERQNPASSIDYTIPQVVSPAGGYAVGSIFDYLGLPTVGQVTAGATYSHSVLPLRAYNLIWNLWFRDENIQNRTVQLSDDGPQLYTDFNLKRRGKRHDYFTSCLPWTEKGGVPVSLPLSGSAPIRTQAGDTVSGVAAAITWKNSATGNFHASQGTMGVGASGAGTLGNVVPAGIQGTVYPSNLYADLSAATNATINQLRQSFQIQRLLERDARGGTRYTELVRSHFGVISPDARLQRPEYLGGGISSVNISAVAQTSATASPGTTSPLATLSAFGTILGQGHGFSQSFTEHGHVIGLVAVRADLTYQQGLRRMWSRSTRYDFYWPVFAMLGEQAVLSKEIYLAANAGDTDVFGYQERWAEYRYNPSQISGLFKSTSAGTLDGWHLAQRFTVRPTLNDAFISDTPPMSRILAVGSAADGAHFYGDFFFNCKAARPMPTYSVPGMIDHF